MMRVTLEIIPFSGEPTKKLGFVDIGNVSGLAEIASYEYEARIDGRVVRGRLDHHLRQHGAVRLAARILGQVVADLERSGDLRPVHTEPSSNAKGPER